MEEVSKSVIQKQEEKAKLAGQIDALADSLEDMTAQAEKSAEYDYRKHNKHSTDTH